MRIAVQLAQQRRKLRIKADTQPIERQQRIETERIGPRRPLVVVDCGLAVTGLLRDPSEPVQSPPFLIPTDLTRDLF